MKRFHIHLGVENLEHSLRFYQSLFGKAPDVVKPDYAKWLLADPAVNFAISTRTGKQGVDHLGFQVSDAEGLAELRQHYEAAQGPILDQPETACCYVRSDKHWTQDPDGLPWEAFHSLADVPTFNDESASACCTPPVEKPGCC